MFLWFVFSSPASLYLICVSCDVVDYRENDQRAGCCKGTEHALSLVRSSHMRCSLGSPQYMFVSPRRFPFAGMWKSIPTTFQDGMCGGEVVPHHETCQPMHFSELTQHSQPESRNRSAQSARSFRTRTVDTQLFGTLENVQARTQQCGP